MWTKRSLRRLRTRLRRLRLTRRQLLLLTRRMLLLLLLLLTVLLPPQTAMLLLLLLLLLTLTVIRKLPLPLMPPHRNVNNFFRRFFPRNQSMNFDLVMTYANLLIVDSK